MLPTTPHAPPRRLPPPRRAESWESRVLLTSRARVKSCACGPRNLARPTQRGEQPYSSHLSTMWSATHQKVSQHGMTTSRIPPQHLPWPSSLKPARLRYARGELASPRRHVQTLSGPDSGSSRPSPEKATASEFPNSSAWAMHAACIDRPPSNVNSSRDAASKNARGSRKLLDLVGLAETRSVYKRKLNTS